MTFVGTEDDPGNAVVSSRWSGQRGKFPVLHHSDGCVQLHYARSAGSPSSRGRIPDSLAPLARWLWPMLTGQGLLQTLAWLLTNGSVARSSSGQTSDLWRYGVEWMWRGCTLDWLGFSWQFIKRHNMLVLLVNPLHHKHFIWTFALKQPAVANLYLYIFTYKSKAVESHFLSSHVLSLKIVLKLKLEQTC